MFCSPPGANDGRARTQSPSSGSAGWSGFARAPPEAGKPPEASAPLGLPLRVPPSDSLNRLCLRRPLPPWAPHCICPLGLLIASGGLRPLGLLIASAPLGPSMHACRQPEKAFASRGAPMGGGLLRRAGSRARPTPFVMRTNTPLRNTTPASRSCASPPQDRRRGRRWTLQEGYGERLQTHAHTHTRTSAHSQTA